LLIGVSGGLARNNADKEDDIDLFFIVSPGTIWISRLLVLLVLTVFHRRRKFGVSFQKNLFCPNMFMTQNHLSVPENKQTVYIAHEVLSLVPVFYREHVYADFLRANEWVSMFLPLKYKEQLRENIRGRGIDHVILGLFRLGEGISKRLQIGRIRRHQTTEYISDELLLFHPQDATNPILNSLKRLFLQHKIPLDTFFQNTLQ
jgi:hypothetical protein